MENTEIETASTTEASSNEPPKAAAEEVSTTDAPDAESASVTQDVPVSETIADETVEASAVSEIPETTDTAAPAEDGAITSDSVPIEGSIVNSEQNEAGETQPLQEESEGAVDPVDGEAPPVNVEQTESTENGETADDETAEQASDSQNINIDEGNDLEMKAAKELLEAEVTLADTTDQSVFMKQSTSPLPEEGEGFRFVNANFENDPQDDILQVVPQGSELVGETLGSQMIPELMPETPSQIPASGEQPILEDDRHEVIVEEEDAELSSVDYQELVNQTRALLEEREKLKVQHLSLQSKLVEHFKRKKSEETGQDESERQAADISNHYATAMTAWQTLQNELSNLNTTQTLYINELKLKLEEQRVEAAQKASEFAKLRRQVSLSAANSKTGKPIPPKVIEQLEQTDARKSSEVSAVLLENIKLRSKVKRADQILRQKEELADGLHLIDFEQLKIENQTYNEKIEERNEDVQKLRRKLVTLVQMVTHLKEKLHFMQKQCTKLRANLDDMDRQVEELRDETPTLKRARDRLRKANLDLQHKNGLRGNRMLLLDYEKKVDATEVLEKELEKLKQTYNTLVKECAQLKS